MRIAKAPLHQSHRRLSRVKWWLTDGQYDRLMSRHPDEGWRWRVAAVAEDVGLWLICLVVGHVPVGDQCGRPEHDYCVTCMKLTPSMARDR